MRLRLQRAAPHCGPYPRNHHALETHRYPALAGIQLSLTSYFLFSSSDVLVKLLSQQVPVFQVILLQVVFAFIPFAFAVYRRGGLRTRNQKSAKRNPQSDSAFKDLL